MRIGSSGEPVTVKPAFVLLSVLALVFTGLLNALPGMNDAIWQDEAVTLLFSATQGPAYPFIAYRSPNNHILFSSLLAGWIQAFPDGVDVFTLRLLPLLMFVAAIPVTYFAGSRIGGPLVGILAAALFSISSVTANFATQLRGYGPSWLFLAMTLLAALGAFDRRAVGWRVVFAISCLGAVAMLPSNFYLCVLVGAAGCVRQWLLAGWSRRDLPGYLVLAASPAAAFLAYAGVWSELRQFSGMDFSAWTRLDLVQEWLRATISDFYPLLPLLLAGLAATARAWLIAGDNDRDESAVNARTAFCLVAGFLLVVAAMPKAPFPRTLTPFLPIWYCALACTVMSSVQLLRARKEVAINVGVIAITTAWMAFQFPLQTCRSQQEPRTADSYDLCYQYFHDDYHPQEVVRAWQMLGQEDAHIVADYEGFYAIRVLNPGAFGLGVHEYRSFSPSSGTAPMIVAHQASDFVRIANALGFKPAEYGEVVDTGYFSLYAPIPVGMPSQQNRR